MHQFRDGPGAQEVKADLDAATEAPRVRAMSLRRKEKTGGGKDLGRELGPVPSVAWIVEEGAGAHGDVGKPRVPETCKRGCRTRPLSSNLVHGSLQPVSAMRLRWIRARQENATLAKKIKNKNKKMTPAPGQGAFQQRGSRIVGK